MIRFIIPHYLIERALSHWTRTSERYWQKRKKESKIDNINAILGGVKDPNLPFESVDVILIFDTYHEFSHPFGDVSSLCTNNLKYSRRNALKVRMAVIDSVRNGCGGS